MSIQRWSPSISILVWSKKGRTYPFNGCSINLNSTKSIPHSFKQKTIPLNDQIVKIHSSISSEDRLPRNDTIKLYNKLDLPNLIAKHKQRNLTTPQLTKQHLQSSLAIEMHGIQYMPSVLFKPFSFKPNLFLLWKL